MKSTVLACRFCSSSSVRPSEESGLFDWLFRWFGRAPYDCMWCGRVSFLVSPSPAITIPDLRPLQRGPELMSPPEPQRASAPLSPASKAPLSPSFPREEAVTVEPPIFAQNGRLRISDRTLEQIIQGSDTAASALEPRRSAALPANGERSRPGHR